MSRRPGPITGLTSNPDIARTELRWKSLGFDPLIDHYRVHGIPGARSFRPAPDNLLAKSVYPRWVHTGLDPQGLSWSYQVVPVSAAGLVGPAGRGHVARSQPSVTATGTELARVGAFDGRTVEFQFAPKTYKSIPTTYPDAVFTHRSGDPASSWPYLLPGPGDAWAGSKVYRQQWNVDLIALEADPVLAIWLVDTTRLVTTLAIKINGIAWKELPLPAGATKGSTSGDATTNPVLVRSFHELSVDRELFVNGENTIEFSIPTGGWAAWDAIGLYLP
ncbi:MAG: hypothetical protein L0G99_13525 [Propionibacteriales bacterium]|nr:hypothetical protein [Propionibacteriales bacterium]